MFEHYMINMETVHHKSLFKWLANIMHHGPFDLIILQIQYPNLCGGLTFKSYVKHCSAVPMLHILRWSFLSLTQANSSILGLSQVSHQQPFCPHICAAAITLQMETCRAGWYDTSTQYQCKKKPMQREFGLQPKSVKHLSPSWCPPIVLGYNYHLPWPLVILSRADGTQSLTIFERH